MATLEKIRTRGGVFITVIIGIALLSFLVNPQDIIQYFQSSRNTVGEIDGRKIDYQKYQEKIDYYTQIATIQSGQAPQEDESERIRNQAWEKMIFEYYLSDQFENVGLGVSEKELGDLATGTNLSPIKEKRISGRMPLLFTSCDCERAKHEVEGADHHHGDRACL